MGLDLPIQQSEYIKNFDSVEHQITISTFNLVDHDTESSEVTVEIVWDFLGRMAVYIA